MSVDTSGCLWMRLGVSGCLVAVRRVTCKGKKRNLASGKFYRYGRFFLCCRSCLCWAKQGPALGPCSTPSAFREQSVVLNRVPSAEAWEPLPMKKHKASLSERHKDTAPKQAKEAGEIPEGCPEKLSVPLTSPPNRKLKPKKGNAQSAHSGVRLGKGRNKVKECASTFSMKIASGMPLLLSWQGLFVVILAVSLGLFKLQL